LNGLLVFPLWFHVFFSACLLEEKLGIRKFWLNTCPSILPKNSEKILEHWDGTETMKINVSIFRRNQFPMTKDKFANHVASAGRY